MNWLMRLVTWPQRAFYEYGSRLAIFLVRRRVNKRPRDMGSWLVLARLYEARNDLRQAIRILGQAHKLAPGNRIIDLHLERLQGKIGDRA